MATFKSFEEIEAWQQARILAKQVYEASEKGTFGRDFALRDQIRRAAVSALCFDLDLEFRVLISPVVYTRARLDSPLTRVTPFFQTVSRESVAV